MISFSPQRSDTEGTVQLDGEGYASVGRPTRWNPNISTVTFKFRTFSSEALLMYLATGDMVWLQNHKQKRKKIIPKTVKTPPWLYWIPNIYVTMFVSTCLSLQKDFMSLELSEGKVKVNFDLGSGVGSAISASRHNDGHWKSLTVSRNKKQGRQHRPSSFTLAANYSKAGHKTPFKEPISNLQLASKE